MHALSRIDQMRLVLPGNIHELRKYIMYHASNKPERWGLTDKGHIKDLKLLAIPGTPVFQGVLLVVSQLFKVVVYVNFGLSMPLIYRCKTVSKDAQGIHLQCIGGVHYNALVADNEELWKENDTIKRVPIEER